MPPTTTTTHHHLSSVQVDVDDSDDPSRTGWKIRFVFDENPFFTNTYVTQHTRRGARGGPRHWTLPLGTAQPCYQPCSQPCFHVNPSYTALWGCMYPWRGEKRDLSAILCLKSWEGGRAV